MDLLDLISEFLDDVCYPYDNNIWHIDSLTGEERRLPAHSLKKEVASIYAISENVARFYINRWLCQKVDVNFDFTELWVDTFGTILPLVQRVVGQTIGLDIVSVQPIELPTGMLFYIDNSGTTQNHQVELNEPAFRVQDEDRR